MVSPRNELSDLARHIEQTVAGPMWHGPALGDLLAGLSAETAVARPVAGAHSIWEIVLHVAVWAEIARLRLHGEHAHDPSPSEDWPAPTPGGWPAAVERMQTAYRELAREVRRLEPESLHAMVAGRDYTVVVLLDGVVEHGTYHGGQIALLKRAIDGTSI
jgi:uncharacterized damage-inducible protein DinB